MKTKGDGCSYDNSDTLPTKCINVNFHKVTIHKMRNARFKVLKRTTHKL